MHLFVYGTLKDEEFLHRLTKRPPGFYKCMEAKLPSYEKTSSIAITEASVDSSVDGHLVLNIEECDLEIIDKYESCNTNNAENDENNWYNRKKVTVITSDEKKFDAFVYIPNYKNHL